MITRIDTQKRSSRQSKQYLRKILVDKSSIKRKKGGRHKRLAVVGKVQKDYRVWESAGVMQKKMGWASGMKSAKKGESSYRVMATSTAVETRRIMRGRKRAGAQRN